MKKTANKKNTSKQVKKPEKTAKPVKKLTTKTVKNPAGKKAAKPPAAKTKNTVKKTTEKPAVKTIKKTTEKPDNNDSPSEKPGLTNMGLPEGSAVQPTGQRRPLIVYPK